MHNWPQEAALPEKQIQTGCVCRAVTAGFVNSSLLQSLQKQFHYRKWSVVEILTPIN